jgi:O-antigen/teichoic acid export membrane protein
MTTEAEHDSRPKLAPLSLRSNFVWTFAGNAFAAVSQWVILALLTKTTDDAVTGQFVLALAICTPIFMFAGLDLRVLQATDGKNQYRFFEYKKLRWISATAALALVPLVCWFAGYSGATFWVICGVAVGKLAESVADIHYALLQKSDRMDRVSRSLVAHSFLSCAGLVAGLLLTEQLAIAVWLGSMFRFGVLFVYDIPLAARVQDENIQEGEPNTLEPKGESVNNRLWALAVLGFPLACKVLLIALVANVTRYFVFSAGGLIALGIFGPIAMLMTAGTTVANALNQSVASRLGRFAQGGNLAGFSLLVKRLQFFYLALGASGVIVAWLAGPMILSLLFREDFAQYNQLLILVMVTAAVQYQGGTLDMAMVAQRRIKVLAPLSAVTLAVLASMCWWLVPTHGLMGAGYAMAVSRIPRVAVLFWLVHFSVSTVAVEDKAKCDDAGNLTVLASGVFLKKR